MALPSRPHHLLSGLRNNGTHSDLTIKCGDSEFKVHKCIVCPQSTFFEKACEEGKWKEGYTNVIDLKAAEGDHPDLADDDPQAVKLMIDYMYLDDYDPATLPTTSPIPAVENGVGVEVTQTIFPQEEYVPTVPSSGTDHPPPRPFDTDDPWGYIPRKKKKGRKKGFSAAEPPPDSFLEMHAKMFAIASKYHIKPLEQTAREKFNFQLIVDWSPADLIAAIEIVCSYTPDREIELRNILKDAIVRHATTLVQQPGFGEAVANIDGLAYDLFCRKTNAQEPEELR